VTAPASGPFDAEQDARRAAHAVIAPDGGRSILSPDQNELLILRALREARVETGAYDRRIARWLAGWEDATCAAVAGWVTRASARPPRTVTIDLGDEGGHVHYALTAAMGEFAERQAMLAAGEGGNYQRERWAEIADEIVAAAEAAMEPQAPEGGER
jgi:hypothetical protein